MIFYDGYTYGMTNMLAQIERSTSGNIKQVDFPVEEIQIISPLIGDSVDCRILTVGVYPEPYDMDI